MITRRSFVAIAAAAPAALAAKKVPVGLELYSVRNELSKDPQGTVKTVAKMGYQGVEFYAPYFSWTPEQAKDMRKLLDDLGIRCFSTHNGPQSFAPENLQKAIDLNKTLGSEFIVMASAGKVEGLDGWKKVAATLQAAADKFKSAKMKAGFHNHQTEWKPIDGVRPMDILARETDKNVILQLDVGTALEMGQDPVAWIEKNPGRIQSMHVKDWSKEKGYRVMIGQTETRWPKIFAAAEKQGGIKYYLIEQEGADLPPFETVEQCLKEFKRIHSS